MRFEESLIRGAQWLKREAELSEQERVEELRERRLQQGLKLEEVERARREDRLNEERRRLGDARFAHAEFKETLDNELEPLEERRALVHLIQELVGDFSHKKAWGGVTQRLGEAIAAADSARANAHLRLSEAERLSSREQVVRAQQEAIEALHQKHTDFFLLSSQLWGSPLISSHLSVAQSHKVTRLAILRYLHELAERNVKWSYLWRSIDTSGRIWLHASDYRGDVNRASQSFTCCIDIEDESDHRSAISLALFIPCGIQGDQAFYPLEEREGYGRGHQTVIKSFKPRLHTVRTESESMKEILTELRKKRKVLSDTLDRWTEDRAESTHSEVKEAYQGWESSYRSATVLRKQAPTKATPSRTWEETETSESVNKKLDGYRTEDKEARTEVTGEIKRTVDDRIREYEVEERTVSEWEKRKVREVSYEVTWRLVNIDMNRPAELLRQWRLSSARDTDSWLPSLVARLEDSQVLLDGVNRVATENQAEFDRIIEEGEVAYQNELRQLALDEALFSYSLRHTVNLLGNPALRGTDAPLGIDEDSFFGKRDETLS